MFTTFGKLAENRLERPGPDQGNAENQWLVFKLCPMSRQVGPLLNTLTTGETNEQSVLTKIRSIHCWVATVNWCSECRQRSQADCWKLWRVF